MLSKNKTKLIQSLSRKKDRDESGLFLVEGNKMTEEALVSNFVVDYLVCTPHFAEQHSDLLSKAGETIVTDKESIKKASQLQNPQDALAVVRQSAPEKTSLDITVSLCLALDAIQDPGNLGTILRIADWFGIDAVINSEGTADIFNPKVVQASMGAIFRVRTIKTNLEDFINNLTNNTIPIYGTFMSGNNIYTEPLSRNGIIVLGNEGNGISESINKLITNRLTIPTFSTNQNKTESLNVAIAAAICCSEFRRRPF